MKMSSSIGKLVGTTVLQMIVLASCTYDYDQFNRGSAGSTNGSSASGGSTISTDQGGTSPIGDSGGTLASDSSGGQLNFGGMGGSSGADAGQSSSGGSDAGVLSCGSSQSPCGTLCIDLSSNANHCGQCSIDCTVGGVSLGCYAGTCGCAVPSACGSVSGVDCVNHLCTCSGSICSAGQVCKKRGNTQACAAP